VNGLEFELLVESLNRVLDGEARWELRVRQRQPCGSVRQAEGRS
jgi:hypothetical protein